MTPEIREAQLLSWQSTKNTAMAVTIDCGDANDIHPAHKQPVGARLALAARALAYGEEIEYSGPVFDSMKIKGTNAVLHFTHPGGGLVAKDGALKGFDDCRRGQSVSSGAGKNRRQDGRGEFAGGAATGRGALRLGQCAGRQSLQPQWPARDAIPDRRELNRSQNQQRIPNVKPNETSNKPDSPARDVHRLRLLSGGQSILHH